MGFFAGLGAAVTALTGLKGLFGKKPKEATPETNILSQAAGVREAAEKYGFNPLTLLQYGQTGASTGLYGGTPPLASAEVLSSGLQGLDDIVTGKAARDAAAEKLRLDLAQLQLDQARSGVYLPPPARAVDRVGNGRSSLGRHAGTHVGVAGTTPVRRIGVATVASPAPLIRSDNPIAPYHERKRDNLVNSPGVFEIQNRATGGAPVTIPGDGEPWGIDELATAVIVGAPQSARNFSRKFVSEARKYNKMTPAERKDTMVDRINNNFKRHPPGLLGLWSRVNNIWN